METKYYPLNSIPLDKVNQNGRIYPREVIIEAFNRFEQEDRVIQIEYGPKDTTSIHNMTTVDIRKICGYVASVQISNNRINVFPKPHGMYGSELEKYRANNFEGVILVPSFVCNKTTSLDGHETVENIHLVSLNLVSDLSYDHRIKDWVDGEARTTLGQHETT